MWRQNASSASAEPPFIDAHTIEVKTPPERVWDVLLHDALPRFGGGGAKTLNPPGHSVATAS